MKIAKIHLENHPVLGTMDITCTGPNGTPLDTIVFAGINGTGKTSLLVAIFDMITSTKPDLFSSYLVLDMTSLPGDHGLLSFYPRDNLKPRFIWHKKFENIAEKIRPKIFYMPTEINFERVGNIKLSFSSQYQFQNIIDQQKISDVPSFIASYINDAVYKNQDLTTKEAIEKVCSEINSLFEILEIDANIVGLNPEGEKLPIFKNSAGKIFNINELSSGEKQLFGRAMALRMLNANNSIILIDEPEISMHPKWQQRIVSVYQKIGKNNQLIIATHSPHVVASVTKESVKLLKRENGTIKITDYNEINGAYGLPVDIVLKDLMGLDTLRDPDVEREIRSLWDFLHQKQYDTTDFRERYQELENLLGSEDEELLLMRIEIAKLESQKGKRNAGHKETPTT